MFLLYSLIKGANLKLFLYFLAKCKISGAWSVQAKVSIF